MKIKLPKLTLRDAALFALNYAPALIMLAKKKLAAKKSDKTDQAGA